MSEFDLTVFAGDDVSPLWGEAYGGEILEASFSTNPEHPRPYLLEPEGFSNAEIDFPAGASTIGGILVALLDKRQEVQDQDTGIVTSLASQLAGARVLLRRRRNGTMRPVFHGVVHGYEVDEDAIVVYRLELRDIRERERRATLFTRNETFVIFGHDGGSGPIEGYGRMPSGEYLIPPAGAWQSLHEDIPHFSRYSDPEPADGIHYGYTNTGTIRLLDQAGWPVQVGEGAYEYQRVVMRWRPKGSGGPWTVLRDMPVAEQRHIVRDFQRVVGGADVGIAGFPSLYLASTNPEEIPEEGQEFELQVLAVETTEDTPFFWDRGTFGTLLAEIYDGEHSTVAPRVPYDEEAMAAFEARTGRARFIATAPEDNMREWVQEHVYAATGHAPSITPEGLVAPIPWELPDNEQELPVLDAERIVPVGNWRHDLNSVINTVEYTYIREFVEPGEGSPWQRLVEDPVRRIRTNPLSVAIMEPQEVKYEPTTVRALGTSEGVPLSGDSSDELGSQLAADIQDVALRRFVFGAVHYVADVLAGSTQVQELQVGDWVLARPTWMPDYATGRRGARRVMQVMGITDERSHVRSVHLVDGGVSDDTDLPEECDPECTTATGDFQRFQVGGDAYYVFTGPGTIQATSAGCSLDCLLVAGGGDGGMLAGASRGQDTVLWATEAGEPTEDLEEALRAVGGGRGGPAASHPGGGGGDGGSGGGGGATSPSTTGTPNSGGGSTPGQGFAGGTGFMNMGLLSKRQVNAGRGGGPNGAADSSPRAFPGWPSVVMGGGGPASGVSHPCGTDTDAGGGGGAGGFLEAHSVPLPLGVPLQVSVAQGAPGIPGTGGYGGLLARNPMECSQEWDFPARPGHRGLAVFRVRVEPEVPTPAEMEGGEEFTHQGWHYHVFRSAGQLATTVLGWAQALLVGGGGGGGSGGGGGGGGGRVKLLASFEPEGTLDVTPGAGGAGGTSGGRGADGTDTTLGELATARGGPGGGGDSAKDGNDGPTGGGGAGKTGAGGAGSTLEGYDGGDGGGWDEGGEDVAWGAGGGGSWGKGADGPEQRTVGNPLSVDYSSTDPDNWQVTDARAQRVAGTGGDQLLHREVEAGEMFVQAKGKATGGDTLRGMGVFARAKIEDPETNLTRDHYYLKLRQFGTHPGGIHENVDDPSVGHNTNRISSWPAGNPVEIGEEALTQFYVADGLQQGWCNGASTAAAGTGHNAANDRTSGFYSQAAGDGGPNDWAEKLTTRSKYATVASLPSGWKARVIAAGGYLVAEATESGGTASIDCSRHGGALAGRPLLEGCPLVGWPTVEVLNDSDELQASVAIATWPGTALVWGSGTLEYASEDNPTGVLAVDDFLGQMPGPERGAGGAAAYLPGWVAALGGLLPYFGGGGGGGSDLDRLEAGEGAVNAGAGGNDTNPGAAGEDETGGGGGGSSVTAAAGGKGGDGLAVVRRLLPFEVSGQRLTGGHQVVRSGDYVYHAFLAEVESQPIGGAVLRHVQTESGRRGASFDGGGTTSGQADAVARIAFTEAAGAFGVILKGSGSAGNENAYVGRFHVAVGPQVVTFIDGAFTSLGTVDDVPLVAGVAYLVRFNVDGTALRLKIWRANEPEPGEWMLDVTGGALPDGTAGLFGAGTDDGKLCDYFAVRKDGGPAPLPGESPEGDAIVDTFAGKVGASIPTGWSEYWATSGSDWDVLDSFPVTVVEIPERGVLQNPFAQAVELEALVAGAGGGGGHGGSAQGHVGGGGGAAEVRHLEGLVLNPGEALPAVVGFGGPGGNNDSSEETRGGEGGESSLASWAARGGVGGGGHAAGFQAGADGPSGGGGASTPGAGGSGIDGMGHDGGQGNSSTNRTGGGGGGVGAAGQDATTAKGGDGGAGVEVPAFAPFGASGWFGGGGGGGSRAGAGTGGDGGQGGGGDGAADFGADGEAGADGTGGGGGGGNRGGLGGRGGHGVVVVRYLAAEE